MTARIMQNPFAKYYALNSKELFPSFDSTVQEKREGTTFYGDFKTAEEFVKNGIEPNALDDTWRRAWREWRNDAAYVVELCLVLNHLSWESYNDAPAISKWYAEKYEYCSSRIFSNGSESEPLPEECDNFTAEEKAQAFRVLD